MEIIHIVLGKANPKRMNGVNKVVYQLASKQAEFGEKVSVWGISKDITINYEERNFETRLFLKNSNPFGFPSQLKKAITAKKSDTIFHIHGGWIPVFYTIGKFISENNIPFVYTGHGAFNTVAMQKNYWIKKLYYAFFEKKMLQYAAKIHCIGKSETLGVNAIYKNNKTVLVPYGFENNVKINLEPTSNSQIVFGFIGRLDIYTKGLDTMMKAFSLFVKKQSEAQLWIIGDSKEKSKLAKMILENNLQNNAFLLGGKFGEEKDDLLKKMDVFVHPSRNEGLPTSVIEAASFGKPSIVTDTTNIGDLIFEYNAGKTIHSQSSDELEQAMQELFKIWSNQNEFLNIRSNALRMVNETYNWKKIILEFNQKLYCQ